MSCDLLPTEKPGPHHQGDVRPLLQERWDLVIAHPECRYLTNAGAKHLYQGMRRFNEDGTENPMNLDRVSGLVDGAKMFMACLNANAEAVAVENPIMHDLARRMTFSGDPQQTVQPWWFGDRMFKATTFRLRNLKPLRETDRLAPPASGTEEWKRWSWVHRMPPGPDRSKLRSKLSEGLAAAMADQWGGA